jgi:hypothetical protein
MTDTSIDKVRVALEMARDFHQYDSKMYAVIDEALTELRDRSPAAEPSGWRYRLKGTTRWHYDETIKNGDDPRVIDPEVCDVESFYLGARMARS